MHSGVNVTGMDVNRKTRGVDKIEASIIDRKAKR